MLTLQPTDAMTARLVTAIRTGDLEALQGLLAENQELSTARILNAKGRSRTPLHIATDWPGYFPNGPAIVTALIGAGGDPNAAGPGEQFAETPLHWAASSDDVEVAAALIAGGADIEAPGASIASGTPLDNAVGYGCWQVARLLVAHGAKVYKLWHAAALGLTPRMDEFFAGPEQPTQQEINDAFWQACSGGQRRAAAYLLARGADMNWVPEYAKQTPLAVAGSVDTGRQAVVSWLQELGAKEGSDGAGD